MLKRNKKEEQVKEIIASQANQVFLIGGIYWWLTFYGYDDFLTN